MDDLLQRLTTALGDRYTIEAQAGQGGMATVFRATDRKHHRQVAIKTLRPELAATIGADRFLKEIEVSAKLQHPHIIPLYDSGNAGGVLYYVMPFVEGESLRDRLRREGKLPFEEAVALTREIASGLAYAHAQGIVHRDIKPENIMLSGGHAVVADFGIARALSAAGRGEGMTGLGIAIGTPAYMSPEQATASEVDARSDQYALACVFYEMVTGATPFGGPTSQAVLTRSLTGPRPRLSKASRQTPPEADGPVTRAMAADPARRFDGVMDFADALARVAGGGQGAMAERRRLRRLAVGLPIAVAVIAAIAFVVFPRRTGPVVQGAESIAVLPFTASGPGVEQLGEGMVDLLTTNLNAVGGIRAVEPRAVLSRWKKAGEPGDLAGALALGRAVKAEAVLLGSIVATGSQVRLSADLHGPGGATLAHAQVDGQADSVLSLVDELSLALVREIWRSNEPVPSLRVSGLTTSSLAAMREYLTGEQYYRRSAWDSAAAAFARAVEQDSTFALAHYRLAIALGWKGGYATERAQVAIAAALRFADRLPQREETLVRAYGLFSEGRLAAADTLRRYLAANPDDADGWYLLGESLYHTRILTGASAATIREPLDRVLAADSSLTPAVIHLLELALAERDSARFASYLALMRRGAAPEEVRAYDAAARAVWSHVAPDSADAVALGQHMGAALAILTAGMREQDATGADALAAYDRVATAIATMGGDDNLATQMTAGRGLVLAGLGRFADNAALADSLGKTSPDQAAAVRLFPMLLGVAPPGTMEQARTTVSRAQIRSPFQAYFFSVVLLNLGDYARAGALVDSMLRDSTKLPPVLTGAFQGARGWHTLTVGGDTAAAIRDLREGAERVGNNMIVGLPLRLRLGSVLASRPASQPEGLALLRNGLSSDIGVYPVAMLALGRAAERANQRQEALFAYGEFLRLWAGADSTAQPLVKDTRDAVARLSREGPS